MPESARAPRPFRYAAGHSPPGALLALKIADSQPPDLKLSDLECLHCRSRTANRPIATAPTARAPTAAAPLAQAPTATDFTAAREGAER